MSRLPRLLGACALAALAGACLDAGPTPLGRHLVRTRSPEQVHLVDGAVGAPNRILFTRSEAVPGAFGFTTQEISTVDDPGPGGGPVEARIVADQVGGALGHCLTPDCAAPIDSLGRLYLYRASFMPLPDHEGAIGEVDSLLRVDPITGELHDFGPTSTVQLSADRARAVLQPQVQVTDPTQPRPPNQLVVVDLDDSMTLLAADGGQFVGDDFYALAKDQLSRLPRGKRVLEDIATNIRFLLAIPTARGPLIILTTFGPMTATEGGVSSFLDPITLTTETLPPSTAAAAFFEPSSSGRYVATRLSPPFDPTGGSSGSTMLTLYDRDTGHEAVATAPSPFVPAMTWRPGRDEVWFDVPNADLFRWPVGGQPEKVAPANPGYSFQGRGQLSPQVLSTQNDPIFTPDGLFRLVSGVGLQSDRPPLDLQSADDAAAPPFRLNQPNLGIAAIWPLGDGRLIVEDFLTDTKKNDAYVVDPVARTQRLIASTGNVVATGRDRCLALLHWVATGGSGELTIVDYATGAETLVAQNVHAVAVDASSDANDALAPGTRVAFLVRNRIASPYDGLWVLELP